MTNLALIRYHTSRMESDHWERVTTQKMFKMMDDSNRIYSRLQLVVSSLKLNFEEESELIKHIDQNFKIILNLLQLEDEIKEPCVMNRLIAHTTMFRSLNKAHKKMTSNKNN